MLSYPIHQAIFAKAFGTEFRIKEKMPDLNVRFKLQSAHRVVDIFGTCPIMTFNKHGDIGLALPVMSVSRDINHVFKKGDLVMPISVNNGIIKIFVPGGCDEEKPIIPKLNPSDLPVCYREGNPVTVKKGNTNIRLLQTYAVSWKKEIT